jgi:hypothetical protein
MELTDIVYLAFATIAVIVCLHVGVFWVSRLIQPPKPRVVYVERERPAPPPQQQFVPPPPPVAPPPPAVQVPTYEQPPIPQPSNPAPRMELPPPIETRQSK